MQSSRKNNIYTAPDIVWATSAEDLQGDASANEVVTALKAPLFRNALQTELVASRFYLNNLSDYSMRKVRESGAQPDTYIDFQLSASVGAHYMRAVYSQKTFIASDQFTRMPGLHDNNIEIVNRDDISTLFGFIHNHTFIECVNVDERGNEYLYTPNIVIMDEDVMGALKKYGFERILESYHAMLQKTIHDHLHFGTLFATAQHRQTPSKRHQHRQAAVFDRGLPEPTTRWQMAFDYQVSRNPNANYFLRSGYETWANQLHASAFDEIYSDEDKQKMADSAKEYLQNLKALKAKMLGAGEEPEHCNNLISYMTCIYISQLSSVLDPSGKHIQSLDADVMALDLPPETLDLVELKSSMKPFLLTATNADRFEIAADFVRTLGIGLKHPIGKLLRGSALERLGKAGREFMTSEEIATAYEDYGKKLKTQGKKDLDDEFIKLDVSMFLYEFLRSHPELAVSEKTAFIWEKVLGNMKDGDGVYHDTAGVANFLRDVKRGIEPDAKLHKTNLTGINAIRYRNLVSVNGLFESLHHDKPLLFNDDPEVKYKYDKKALPSHAIAQSHSDHLFEAIRKRDIPQPILTMAQQDLRASQGLSAADLGIPDYYHDTTQKKTGAFRAA